MDTLASLALATENASEKLLQKKSNIQKDNIFTRKMLKHIIGQSFYQIIIMIIIVFDGLKFFLNKLKQQFIRREFLTRIFRYL